MDGELEDSTDLSLPVVTAYRPDDVLIWGGRRLVNFFDAVLLSPRPRVGDGRFVADGIMRRALEGELKTFLCTPGDPEPRPIPTSQWRSWDRANQFESIITRGGGAPEGGHIFVDAQGIRSPPHRESGFSAASETPVRPHLLQGAPSGGQRQSQETRGAMDHG